MAVKIIVGENDLETWCKLNNPELMNEWNYEKNSEINMQNLSFGSSKKVWWRCQKGHEWVCIINHRTIRKNGCPYCSGQKVLIGYNDLATTRPNISKEWNYEKNQNLTPDMFTQGSGVSVWWKCKDGHEWKTSIANRNTGYGCPICATFKRAQKKRGVTRENSFGFKYSELLKEWDYKKNNGIDPYKINVGCNDKVWWKCSKCGNEWSAPISRRSSGGGCRSCGIEKRAKTRRIASNDNSLGYLFPQLLNEWNYEKNLDLDPYEINRGSNLKVWWVCEVGHEWQACISSRTSKLVGCPICKKEYSTSFDEHAIFYYIKQYYNDAISGERNILEGKELDIYIPTINVAIEYDGVVWHKDSEKKKELKMTFVRRRI